MRETLKMMKSILTGKEKESNENELIKEYQEKLSPSILAYFYCNNFGLIIKTSDFYPVITDEDKASFCLQELDKCLQNYKLNSDTKFMTYFITFYKRRLWAENEMLHHNNRKINLEACNIYDTDIINYNGIEIDDENLVYKKYDLTNEEINQCKLLIRGYSNKEIADILKLKPITIYKRIEKIKQKILKFDINFA